jgi:fermentation-respiration switch protein FrsA (DUF1100 family)
MGIYTSACSSLFYYPKHDLLYDPAQINLEPKDIWIKHEAYQIHAWYFKANQNTSKGTFVFFHGNAENLTSHYLSLVWLLEYNYDYIIFDYPGYGQSSGEPTPKSTVESGKLVLNWVHTNLDSRPLIIYGNSLGGIVSLKVIEDLKNQIPIKAAIIDSSFNSYKKIGRRALSRTWLTWLFQPLSYVLLSDKYAPDNLSQIAPTPILFIHGKKDQVVESVFSEEMFSEAAEPKELWLIPNGTHGSSFYVNKGEYRTKLIDFIENNKSLNKKSLR